MPSTRALNSFVLSLSVAVSLILAVAGGTANAETLEAGGGHTCAIVTGGALKCWGANAAGQLGDGSRTDRHTFVGVTGLGSSVQSVAAGDLHTCALLAAGNVECWGFNGLGQLGDGSAADSSAVPVDVNIAEPVASIAVGEYHSCAVTAAGALKCWGFNSSGQLGDGTSTDRNTPVDVPSLGTNVAAVSAGLNHTCVLTKTGGVKCWGDNGNGQLGDGTTTAHTTPADVPGLTSGVASISAGRYHTCAITVGGTTKCWGAGWSGKIGNFGAGDEPSPVNAVGLETTGFAVSAGGDHTCAVTTLGGAMCWGFNAFGQIGNGLTATRIVPTEVIGLGLGVTAITAGSDHTCALMAIGTVRCWGDNSAGGLGNDSPTDKSTPTPVSGLGSGIDIVSAGANHSCAIDSGAASCWGSNWAGQLGDGANVARSTSAGVSGLATGVSDISAGNFHSCAVVSGAAKCWGFNAFGQLGNQSIAASTTPVDAFGLGSGVTDVAAGSHHSCAVDSGEALCWGRNLNGQLGTGDTTEVHQPTTTGLTSGVTAVATGSAHSCAVVSGGAKCWGWNRYGQVGVDASTFSQLLSPVDVTGLTSGVSSVTTGFNHSCALLTDNTVRCWGHDYMGQLGNGAPNVSSYAPVDPGLTGVSAVDAGGNTTCALLADKTVRCWGYNGSGQLGDGSNANQSSPVSVSSISDATAISVGDHHACALLTGGAVKCWGYDGDGQLGDAATLVRTAVDVVGLSDVVQPSALPPGPQPGATPAPAKATVSPRIRQRGKAKRRRGKLIVRLNVSFPVPAGVEPAAACNGSVGVSVKPRGARKVRRARARFVRSGSNCLASVTLKLTPRSRKHKLTFTLTHSGNEAIMAFSLKRKLRIR